ncbi:DUF288 domain-containing protein [archaeon]|jgi:hypothetical protein|nr:DUF288 domain-containing protein [archaeon]MBT4352470.1 DUF288 domain-containing protein [archaeon]MBT4647073.1 DUF288 domain-containing protein [archaeon]MBT6820982.1 DUF288 domain-containing protein [archaeon]MBT7392695.1 DUF288 domain-containing protein [archaeon]
MTKGAVVITTIFAPTKTVHEISRLLGKSYDIIVAGDKKSPPDFDVSNVEFLDIKKQEELGFSLSKDLLYNHYCRKNIGYLHAIKKGADYILETDDDNIPYENFGVDVDPAVTGEIIADIEWYNVYNDFSDEKIWPRGFPLEKINQNDSIVKKNGIKNCLVQQFLADKNPDLDAIYRLTNPYKDIDFEKREPVILDKGVVCPYNSQNTITFKEAFPLLYLPSYVTFRMTDIWRGLISQIILWSIDSNLSFHSSTVYQDRNEHNLLKDFEHEVPGYLLNQKIIDVLKSISYEGSVSDRLLQAYVALVDAEIVPEKELVLVKAWIDDLENIS